MTVTDLQTLAERAGALLLIMALAGGLASAIVRPRGIVILAMAAVAFAALLPVGGLSATDYLFSVVGPLSGASILFLAIGIADGLSHGGRLGNALDLPTLALMILVAGIPFYALALGVGSFDPYRLGFGGWQLPLVLAVLLAFGLWANSVSVALWLAISGALYLLGAYASRNLVDYLIDPVAVVMAALVLIGMLISGRRRR